MKIKNAGTMILALSLLMVSVLACSFGSSPTKTFTAFYEAQKKKDVPGIKKTLSKGTLAMMEKAAKEQNKSLDDSLKEGFDNPTFKAEEMPPTRNEKINGDNATLEVQDKDTKKWQSIPFVKEDGEWKIAFDKMLDELLKSLGS